MAGPDSPGAMTLCPTPGRVVLYSEHEHDYQELIVEGDPQTLMQNLRGYRCVCGAESRFRGTTADRPDYSPLANARAALRLLVNQGWVG